MLLMQPGGHVLIFCLVPNVGMSWSMSSRRTIFVFIAALTQVYGGSSSEAEVTVRPTAIVLDLPEASQQILVTERIGDLVRDVTREAEFIAPPDGFVSIRADGLVRPTREGAAQIIVKHGGSEIVIPLQVTGLQQPEPVSFEHEVQPILTKARCNSGGCHGKAEGQNGFKLSLLGFDSDSDHEALVKEAKGRRISITTPEQSMLLLKATAVLPHGGGRKIEPSGPQYERLFRWLAEGAPRTVSHERRVVGIEVEPAQLVIAAHGTQQLRVTSIDEMGARRCATIEADYISNATHVCEVNTRGLIQASDINGEAAILVRYLGHVAVCRVALPRIGGTLPARVEHNLVDQHTWDKWQRLNIPPSELADDATFLRRASLDVIGTLPTADEARAFLMSTAPDKRARLVDSLLARPEYADYWAMRWSDLLKADKIKITSQGTVGLTRWLRKQFRENRPFDEMAREILIVQGPVQGESPAAFFKTLDTPEVMSRAVSQLFLGVRIECAQCHHHPSERWSQDDYAGLAGFFTGVTVKRLPDGTESIVSRGGTDLPHPRTKTPVPARALGAGPAHFASVQDRRHVLATWMTAPENPFFARAIANRMWANYFGRGLVDPIDDQRATNPATNEPLLDALATHLRESRYDLQALTRLMLNSRAYQLGPAIDTNRDDRQHFSHVRPRALPAEVLLDAISQTTGVPEKFNGWPEGVRSIQVWDNRMPSYFFRIFGRPARATVCECERSNEPSISQALHLLNSPEVNDKLSSRSGIARRLASSPKSDGEIVEEIYLSTLSRFPTDQERSVVLSAFSAAESPRHQAIEDILWAVMNTKEFLYNH